MRAYAIDDLHPDDVKKLERALLNKDLSGSLAGIFWLPLPESLLNPEQLAHLQECGPFALALETFPEAVKMELLVRSRHKLRCSCIAYATPAQREHMITVLDAMLKDLDIPV